VKKVLAVAVILVLAISLGACAQKPQVKEKPPIKIGVQVPLTGDWAYEGQGMVNGINMLAEQINNAGGLLDGRKIEVIPADDKSDAKEAALAARDKALAEVLSQVPPGAEREVIEAEVEVRDEGATARVTVFAIEEIGLVMPR